MANGEAQIGESSDAVSVSMRDRVRAFDWAATPLGPAADWSGSLQTAVDLMLDAPQIASLVVGPERLFLYNDRAAANYGNRHPGALGQPLTETFTAAAAAVGRFYDRAFAGESLHVPAQPLDTSGSDTGEVYDAYLTPVRERNGDVAAVLMTGVEIGAQMRAEAALRQSEERLGRVLEGMEEAFGLIGPDFTILEYNREALRIDGRRRQEIVGRSHWDAFPGTEHSAVGRALKKAMADRQPQVLEHQYAWTSGRASWLEMRVYPTADRTLAVFWRDVTERKAADSALRTSEERYRALFESMDQAYAVVEVLKNDAGAWADFRFVEVNPAFSAHTGMPWPIGRTATELLGAPNPRWAELYGQALDTGEPIRVEEGEPLLGRVFDLNIFTLDRALNRVAVLFTDITDRRRAQETQQVLLDELQHRVRNILAVVRSIARRTSEGQETAEEYALHLEGRLSALARTQVLLTRSPGAGVELEDIVFDELLGQLATEERFTVEGPRVVLAPKAAEVLSLAVHELATNATKYGAFTSARATLRVEWRTEQRGGATWLVFEWREQGLFIRPAPRKSGFGTELIERRVPYELRGAGSLRLNLDGVECRIEFPLVTGESVLQPGFVRGDND